MIINSLKFTRDIFLEFIKRVKNIFWPLVFSKEFDSEDLYLIFSEGSGGSTWLMEMVQSELKAFICWEPLHPKRGLVTSRFGPHPSLDDNGSMELQYYLNETFKGKRLNTWTTSKNSNLISMSFRMPKRLLVKFVRGNRMLPSLLRKVSFQNKPVLLLRHPIATVSSQMQRFNILKRSDYSLSYLVNRREYIECEDFLESLTSELERELALYCLVNKSVYTNYSNLGVIVIFYEEFLLNPEQELVKIFNEWKIPRTNRKFDSRKPSSEGLEKEGAIDPQKQLRKWRESIKKEDSNRLQEILDYFEIKCYKVDFDLPLKTENL